MMAKMRTSLDVKAAVEAVRSDFLQHGRRHGNTAGAPVAASGSWNAAAGVQGPLAGLPEGWGEPHALQAAAAALAGPMFAGGGSVRRGSQPMSSMPSSRRASGGTVRRLSHVSQQHPQQDAWGLLPGSDAGSMLGGGVPPSHKASVSRSSIKRTSVDLSSLDPEQLAATAAPVAVQDDYMDPFRAAQFAQHEAEQMQHAQRMHFDRGAGGGPFHHPSISAASVGSLMDWARPPPQHQLPPGGAVWAGVGRTSVDSAAAGMLRRAAPSAPFPGYRAGPSPSVGRNSMPSSIKRGSGTGVRSALGPVTFGPPPPHGLGFEHGQPMPFASPPMAAPLDPAWKPSVARRSFQRPVRSEAVANLLAEGPVRSGPIWGSMPAADVDATGTAAPPMAARRPYRSVRAASEGGRRGLAGGRESCLATAARMSARFGTVADAGGSSSVPLMGQPLATVEPSEGSLTSMCGSHALNNESNECLSN